MNIIVLGNGKLGFAVAGKLCEDKHNVTVVDRYAEALRPSELKQDVITLQGDAMDVSVLTDAGAADADLVIAAMGSDEQNIVACHLCRKLGTGASIARVRSPEIAKSLQLIREDIGLNFAVNPEQSTASEISRVLRFPSATHIEFFSRGRVEIVEFTVRQNSRLIGHKLNELQALTGVRTLICAVQRGDEVFIPHGDFAIAEGDVLSITGTPNTIATFFRKSGRMDQRVQNVMIIGGGKVSYYLTRMLIDAGMTVKIVEKDRQRCEELAAACPKALVIEADGSDHDVLIEEGVDQSDALVALTGIDEENIVTSMFANTRSIRKVVAKINHIPMSHIMRQSAIECIVTPHVISAAQVLRYVRAMENKQGSHMIALSRIANDHVDAMEFRIHSGFDGLNIPLKELKIRKGILIACIIRSGRIVYPGGNDAILNGDSVIIVSKSMPISEINDILA